MSNTTRIRLLKFTGWTTLAAGLLLIIGDLVDTGFTFQDFRQALRGGLAFIALACFFLTMAGFHQRIIQLEDENAALRAENERFKQFNAQT